MWKLSLPDKDGALVELEAALTYASGVPKFPLTAGNKLRIQEIYNAYESLGGVADNTLLGTDMPENFRNAVEAAYSEVQLNNRLEDLRNRLLLNAGLCPCCGILPADELDHHLPKSTYQLLAVYSSNLVPYCHKCNNKKRTVTGVDPNERFIHFYYDRVPQNVRFFFAVTDIVDKALVVNFELRAIPELDAQMFTQMRFQTQRVGLNNRLTKAVNDFLLSFAFGLEDAFETGGELATQKFLQGNARQFARQQGLNHWRAALLEDLANNREFYNGGFYKPLGLVV